ncbi:phosphoribosylglycinamide formyltransferase [Rhodohalobacter sp. 614A]|uniref:phosphoribosylglycinamide formyltransferase n=1 Tax=Rhodohalobacter sp. 614A TaxID=2908649 RepID=UPI001F3AA314
MKKLVIFASGSGTNMQAIIDEIEGERIQAEIVGLITNKNHIQAIERAKKFSIPVCVITETDEKVYASTLEKQLSEWRPDLIVLAGFLKKIPDSIIRTHKNKIINIHPALLPKYGGKGFYGINVHKAVLESGDKETGCTVHFVNEEYDKGPIISQAKVRVFPSDTPEILAKRVLKAEHELLPSVIKKLINQK